MRPVSLYIRQFTNEEVSKKKRKAIVILTDILRQAFKEVTIVISFTN